MSTSSSSSSTSSGGCQKSTGVGTGGTTGVVVVIQVPDLQATVVSSDNNADGKDDKSVYTTEWHKDGYRQCEKIDTDTDFDGGIDTVSNTCPGVLVFECCVRPCGKASPLYDDACVESGASEYLGYSCVCPLGEEFSQQGGSSTVAQVLTARKVRLEKISVTY